MRLSDIFTLLFDLFNGGLKAGRERINQINSSGQPYQRPVNPQVLWHIWAILGMIGVNYLVLVHVPHWMDYWNGLSPDRDVSVNWEPEVWQKQETVAEYSAPEKWLESNWGREDSDGIVPVDVEPVPINLHQVRRRVQIPDHLLTLNTTIKVRASVLVNEKGDYVRHRLPREHQYPDMVAAVGSKLSELSFLPALRDGKPVPYWVEVSFIFEL